MYKIAVMGDRASISGYAALGLEIFPFEDGEEENAASTLRSLSKNGYAVIYITELLAEGISDEIDRYRDNPTPAVILIPGVRGNTGKGMTDVGISVEKAVGSNILQNQE